ncbi:MAG: type II secretion system minor pseudopilin GspJ [Rhodanobacteraceae bacterium]
MNGHVARLRKRDADRTARSAATRRSVRSRSGFSLVELLVALAVFAALAAAAYGGLAEIARARGALAAHQDRFAAAARTITALERDLRQAVSRPVRGGARGEEIPALAGTADRLELTRLGFANPRAEARSNLERVAFAVDNAQLMRGRYAVLDRAPDSVPAQSVLLDQVNALRVRYFGTDGIWRDAWPPAELAAGTPGDVPMTERLPRAIEFRIDASGLGELRRIVELPSSIPQFAADRALAPAGDDDRTRPRLTPPAEPGSGAPTP